MTTHDIDIELPAEFCSGNSVPATVATIKRERMEEILREAIEADRKCRGEPVGYVSPYAIKRLKAGGNAVVGGMMPGFEVPLYAAPQPSEPVKVNAIFETQDGEVIGTTDAKVKRVEWQDDGSLTVVIDYWPQPAEPDSAKCAECGAEMIHVRPGKWQHPDCSQSP